MPEKILYYSTNRNLNTSEIKGFKEKVAFKDALFMGMAPDKGLFMPSRIPVMIKNDILALKGKPYHEVAYEVLRRFLYDEINDEELKEIAKDAYDFDVPIEKLDDYRHIVRLDRGPSASFKDFAAALMAR